MSKLSNSKIKIHLLLIFIILTIIDLNLYKCQNASTNSTNIQKKLPKDEKEIENNEITNTKSLKNQTSKKYFIHNKGNKLCSTDKDCSDDYICDNESNKCIHKNIFPMHFKQIFSIILVCLTCAIATSTGIGGGSIITTTLLSIENFTPK